MALDKMYRPDYDEPFINPYVLCSVINYTVQKHLVDEKIRYRAETGKIDPISKQAPSGKKSQGGLRISRMESDSLTAAGVCNILIEFFGRLSSNIQSYVCRKCGLMCVNWISSLGEYQCKQCGPLMPSEVCSAGYSYNPKLFDHILFSCGAIQQFITVDLLH